MGRARSIAKVIGFNVAGLALALVSAEIALRIIKPEALQARLKMNESTRQEPAQAQGLFDFTDFRFKPESQGQQTHAEYKYSVQHDRHGWRNPCFDFNKPATSVIIGDSFAYGIGVSDQDLMQCQIKKHHSDENIYVLGIPGANIFYYIGILKTQKQTIQSVANSDTAIDIMLCMGNDYEGLIAYGKGKNFNDFLMPSAQSASNPTSPKSIDIFPSLTHTGVKARLSRLNSWIMKQAIVADIHLLQALKLALLQSSSIKDHGSYFSNYGGQTFYKHGAPDNSEILAKALKRLNQDFRDNGFNLGKIILVPDGSEISEERLERDSKLAGFNSDEINIDHKYSSLLKACNSENATCLDFRHRLTNKDYYQFDGHFRPSGVAVMSKAFMDTKSQH